MNEENLKKLPKPLQKLISEGVWEEKTKEIAQKYSLNENQTENFIDLVLFILLGVDEKKDLTEMIASEVETSNLLAEQLKNDVEKRVLEYAIKVIDDYDKGTSTEKTKIDNQKNTKEDLPEVRPEITPVVEKNEPVRVVEPVQRPISVPRYTGVPLEEDSEKTPEKSVPETPKQPEPVPTPVKKYVVDPYREPLE